MSVQSNSYVMVGTRLPLDHFTSDQLDDDLEPYRDSAYKGIEHHNGLCAIVEHEGEEPCVFIGRVLAKSDDQNGNYGFGRAIDATLAMTPELQTEVTKLVQDQFNLAPDVRLWIFTHYR